MRGIKGMQDETTRKTRELEFELGQFSAVNTKMDDLKQRVEENGQSMHNIYITNTKKMANMTDQFESLKSDFRKEEEYMRVARKATDNLSEEYCRIVHSVASEKQRNLMYIEKAKKEFINELI